MTKDEIINMGEIILNSESPEFSEFKIILFLPFFEKRVNILFQNFKNLNSIPEMILVNDIINELLVFSDENKIWLKKEIWNHYEINVSNTSYNIVPQKGFLNEKDANMAYFNIYNEEDAFKNVHLEMIYTDLFFLDFRYFNLIYKCPWDNEHGIKIGIKNGTFDSIV